MTTNKKAIAGIDAAVIKTASIEALKKLAPASAIKNPVMLVVLIGTVLCLALTINGGMAHAQFGFRLAVTAILFITVLFANFAEAIAEARGRGQAQSLRAAQCRARTR